MRARRHAGRGMGGLMLLAAAAGCQGASQGAAPAGPAAAPAPAASAPPVPTTRIGRSTRNGSQAIGQVLIDSGLLAENGLEGTLLHVDGPSRAVAALVGGD